MDIEQKIDIYLTEGIKLSQYANAGIGDVVEYVVHDENTLGYIQKIGANSYQLGILHGSGIKGGKDWKNGPYMLTTFDEKKLRKATKKDFEEYRVSWKGHLK